LRSNVLPVISRRRAERDKDERDQDHEGQDWKRTALTLLAFFRFCDPVLDGADDSGRAGRSRFAGLRVGCNCVLSTFFA
jgi:hypothetical protein